MFKSTSASRDVIVQKTSGSTTQKNTESVGVAELPCFGLKVSAMLVHQRSDTRTVYFHALYFVLNLDNPN